jgi:hypothetical protein
MRKPILCLFLLFLSANSFLAVAQKRVSMMTAYEEDHEKGRAKQKILQKTYTKEGKLLEEYDYQSEFYQSYAYNAVGKVVKHIIRAAEIEETLVINYMPDMIVRTKTDAVNAVEEKETFLLDNTGKVVERMTNNTRDIYHFNEFDSVYEITTVATGALGRKKRTFIEFDKNLKKPLFRADYDYNEQLIFEKTIRYNSRGAVTEDSERDFRFNIFKLNNYTYDESGRLTVHEFSDYKQGEHQITTYTYFPDNQISQTSQVKVLNNEGKLTEFTTFEYRSGIRYKSTTYKGSEKLVILYDSLGYKTSEITYDGDRLVRTLTYEYKYF